MVPHAGGPSRSVLVKGVPVGDRVIKPDTLEKKAFGDWLLHQPGEHRTDHNHHRYTVFEKPPGARQTHGHLVPSPADSDA